MAARRWRWLWVVFGVSVLGVGAAAWWTVRAVGRMSEFQRVARTLPTELAAARREHIPITPADLSPAAPLDIFTGQPQHYRRTPKGFLLYSVGENLRDDGGSTAKPKKGDPPLDMVLEAP